MAPESKHKLQPILFWSLAALALNLATLRLPFFWDNILNSRIAQWYVADGFSSLTIPEMLDAGHPPFFSLYLAGLWAVFGKSLAVAHLAMLPFLLGTVALTLGIGRKLLPERIAPWAPIVLLVDPTLLAQSVQITPDIALLFFFLLCCHSLLHNQRIWLAAGLIGMGMVSFRGMLGFAVIGLMDVGLTWIEKDRKLWDLKHLWPYFFAGIYAFGWLLFHRHHAGWMFSPPEATYGGHRKLEGMTGMLRNALITVWRLLDHGRIFGWFIAIGAAAKWISAGYFTLGQKKLALFTLVPAITLALLFIPFSNPIGHRYFLPSYLFLGLFVLGLAGMQVWGRRTGTILAFCAIGWISGHAWVYPDTIAKGWDASLAHLPYHLHRASAVDFLDRNNIHRHEVCTDFPAIAAESFIDPEMTDTTRFRPLNARMDSTRFILYSNVCNGFSDEMLLALADTNRWRIVFQEGKWPVRVQVFERVTP